MKSPPPSTMPSDDCDDIFGPPRTYATGYCPPKNRPSMISAKYRQKEERRKVLKISVSKLKKIEDPEASLCRSVLINNTMKRLQQEARDEKIQKQQLNYPRCYDHDNFLNLKSEFIKNELKSGDGTTTGTTTLDSSGGGGDFTSSDAKLMDSLHADFAIESEFDAAKMVEEISALHTERAKSMAVLEENLVGLGDSYSTASDNNNVSNGSASVPVTTVTTTAMMTTTNNNNEHRFPSRKRSLDEMDMDCDVQDVLSQLYMPPTPRMLTSIDEDDEDVNVVDDEPVPPKRVKLDFSELCDEVAAASNKYTNTAVSDSLVELVDTIDRSAAVDQYHHQHRVSGGGGGCFLNSDMLMMTTTMTTATATATTTAATTTDSSSSSSCSRLRYVPTSAHTVHTHSHPHVLDMDTSSSTNSSYSCGHASLFSDLQCNVFHSLITSLET